MANTPKLVMPEITQNQESKYITHNTALRYLDALVQCTVIDKDLEEDPSGPSDGDTYIVDGDGIGDWYGQGGDIAYYESSAWRFHTPEEGWVAYVQDENRWYMFDGTSWVPGPTRDYIISLDIPTTPTGGQTVFQHVFVRGVAFPDDFAGSDGLITTAPDSSDGAEFSIKRNGVEVATMSFDQSVVDATFSTSSSGVEPFEAGDVLTVVAPNPADGSLAGLSFTLRGVLN